MSTSLPEPNFIDRDPVALEAEMVAAAEDFLGRPLQPAQQERVWIRVMAYLTSLERVKVQEAGKQNLVRYAKFPMLDHLGALKGVPRLDAEFALTTLRFTLVAAQAFDVLIPTGTRVKSADGKVIFATKEALTIAAGDTTGDVIAVAQTAGTLGNGYLAGQVATLMDPIAHVAGAANTTTSAGGAAVEDDDAYRERIILAPEGYSTAGPVEAYRFHALKASAAIIDVSAVTPAPGEVSVYVLTADGAPSGELLDQVEEYLNDDKIRPLTDLVSALAPTAVDSDWELDLLFYTDADAPSALAEVEAQLEAYANLLRSKLGMDIVPERIEAIAMNVAGVYRATLGGVAHQVLTRAQFANVTSITVNSTGVADG